MPITPYTVDVQKCQIVDQLNGASVVTLIENGVPVVTHTPVHVEPAGNQRVSGIIGGAGVQGAAFNFQVFKYRSGARLKMNCEATFTPVSMGRRRRSAQETTEFSVPVIFYEVGSEENEDDIPIIEIHEEFDEIVEPVNLDNGVEISPLDSKFNIYHSLACYYILGNKSKTSFQPTNSLLVVNLNVMELFCVSVHYGWKSQLSLCWCFSQSVFCDVLQWFSSQTFTLAPALVNLRHLTIQTIISKFKGKTLTQVTQ